MPLGSLAQLAVAAELPEAVLRPLPVEQTQRRGPRRADIPTTGNVAGAGATAGSSIGRRDEQSRDEQSSGKATTDQTKTHTPGFGLSPPTLTTSGHPSYPRPLGY